MVQEGAFQELAAADGRFRNLMEFEQSLLLVEDGGSQPRPRPEDREYSGQQAVTCRHRMPNQVLPAGSI